MAKKQNDPIETIKKIEEEAQKIIDDAYEKQNSIIKKAQEQAAKKKATELKSIDDEIRKEVKKKQTAIDEENQKKLNKYHGELEEMQAEAEKNLAKAEKLILRKMDEQIKGL